MKHATPTDVVALIAKHIPRHAINILEPAVGKGALIKPLLSKNLKQLEEIVALDIEDKRLCEANRQLKTFPGKKLFIHEDYLTWKSSRSFCCVIMNPPFNAKQRDFITFENNKLPIEAAFVTKAICELKHNGTLIAILPESVISGKFLADFRRDLLRSIQIRKVYELNKFSFPGIEGKFYVLVARKGARTSRVILEKPFSEKSVSIKLNTNLLSSADYRLDFSYQFSLLKLEEIVSGSGLEFRALSELAQVQRGGISAPYIHRSVLHTSSWAHGAWNKPRERHKNTSTFEKVMSNDLLVKRVARNCHSTFGIYSNSPSVFSDCVFRIRPRSSVSSLKLLFAIRTIYSGAIGKYILVRGTGANFITSTSLMNLKVPVNLAEKYPLEFEQYAVAVQKRNLTAQKNIEEGLYSIISEN